MDRTAERADGREGPSAAFSLVVANQEFLNMTYLYFTPNVINWDRCL